MVRPGIRVFLGTLSAAVLFTTFQAHASCAVFLVPGAFATDSLAARFFLKSGDYFSEYRKFFAEKGCAVGTAEFPADATIEESAVILRDEFGHFLAKSGAREAVLIAHSQGGLDARFALKELKLSHVSALVTIGTPHRGTPLADWVVSNRKKGGLVYWLLRVLGGYDLRALRFAGEARPEFLARFASHFSAVPGVRYASAVAVCRSGCGFSFRALDKLVKIGSGDGIIPSASQSFGTVLGEYDLDHVSEVGVDSKKRAERERLLQAIWVFLMNT